MPQRSNDFLEIFSPAGLRLAWERYIRSGQREAKDHLGIRAFRPKLAANLDTLSSIVLHGEYAPSRPPKFFKCKSSGMQRSITVLPLIDSLVFQSIANHVATKIYDRMEQNNLFVFGSVLHHEVSLGLSILKNPKAAFHFFQPWQVLYKLFADSVNNAIEKQRVEYKFETDITGFYDSIPHYNLLAKVSDMSGLDPDVLDLLADCLNYWSGTRDMPTPGVGIPQSTVASHFFANLFLHDLDNLMKDRALPYYRYMDDMRIYGYHIDQLQRTLIEIDRHLKQHALSLNAKKTDIEKITPKNKRKSLVYFQYHIEPESVPTGDTDNFSLLATQDTSGEHMGDDEREHSTRDDILEICYRDLEEVRTEVGMAGSARERAGIEFEDRAVERNFLRLGFLFRQAIQLLRDSGRNPRMPKGATLKGWLFLADRYFWRIDQFLWVLRYYENDTAVKNALIVLLKKYEMYEWVQCELYQCLALSQQFSSKELRVYYEELRKPHSWYVKRSIYMLLLRHSQDDPQLIQSILTRAAAEQDDPLRREVVFMEDLFASKGVTREEILEAFGLT